MDLQIVNELQINDLLTKTGGIIEKYNAIAHETGRAFNIFEIARIEEKEVIVCRVLTELLNPKGRHGQGGVYLKLFLRDCLCMGDTINEINVEDMLVMSERFTDKGRPIDVVIEGCGKFIPIEVKLYAGDQSLQCYDYCMFARTKDSEAKIVYLTLFGNEPSQDSKGELADDDIVLLSFDNHILRWLEKCLALPDTIRKTPIREILIQFISAITKITNNMEDKPKMELVKLLSRSSQQMQNAKIIADTLEGCRLEIVKKFFAAFHERFGKNFERQSTDWDFDAWDEVSPNITYMFEPDIKPGVSVVFCLNADKYDTHLMAGFCMMKDGAYFGDRQTVKEIREHYGIELSKSSDWYIYFENIVFEGDKINLMDFKGSYENYFKLFDPQTFDEILDSTIEQAAVVLAKITKVR